MKRSHIFIFFIVLFFGFNSLVGGEPNLFFLALPDHDLAVQLDFTNFRITDQLFKPGLEGRKISAEDTVNEIVLTAFIETNLSGKSAKEYRADIYKIFESPLFVLAKYKILNEYEIGNMAIIEYIIEEMASVKINQQNVYIEIAGSNTWIELHLSKAKYKKKHKKLFDNFIENIKIIDNPLFTSLEYFSFASHYYLTEDYKTAALCYEKSLDSEKEFKTLTDEQWLVLIDNLGMSYGLQGDYDNAQKIFEYGLSIRPEYPMFYYNLACTYGEKKDMINAVKNLEKAFEYKDKMITGEKIPDPAKDDSFKKFLKEPMFINFLEKINKSE